MALTSFFLSLVTWLIYCHTSPTRGEECKKVDLHNRLECGYRGITEDQCVERGCCYDKQQMVISVYKCYFPGECEQLLLATGSGSALLALSGREQHRLPLDNAYDGDWCTRDIPQLHAHMHFEINLKGARDIYLVSENDLTAHNIQQLQVSYTNEHGLWNTLNTGVHLSQVSSLNTDGTFLRLTAWKIRIKMKDTPSYNKSCSSVNFVSCPSDYIATTTEEITATVTTEELKTTTQRTRPTTTTEAPVALPVIVSDTTEADKRPSAIALGFLGIILVTGELVLFVLMDLPTFKDNLVSMAHNLGIIGRRNRRTLTGERVNGKVIFQRISSTTNGIQDEVHAHVCHGKRTTDPPNANYKSLPYIDQDAPNVV